ncbi:phage tail tape measure protein [Aeromonas caviae]|uniref:phage tail tape measure protein n=1 Tax=Aeromonas caviae TaxID=648 RepID=UPI0029DDB2F0|nr:phage tail tape measure protein [Aeromonas caviae]MDX7814375.1 phage tail tape measure protein [Aeromonas caviae]
MAKQLVTDIVINLAGNLATKARQFGQSMGQFAANNQRAMNLTRMSLEAAGRGIDSIGSRYVALGATLAGGAAVRGYSQLDRRISRIAIAADISREKSAELYDEIQRVSNLKGIRIDPTEATAAVEEILTKTGDLDYAIKNLPNIAAVIQATGAGGLEVGGIFTEFKKLAIDSSEAAMRAIDTLNLQGKSGAFTLASMAKEGPKIFAAYAATGRQGAEAVTELGAALQIIRQGVGSDAEAVTAFESIIRDITRPETVKKLKQLGNIDVFDPEQLKQGKEVMRSLPVLIEEIVTKSKGLSTNLADLNLTDEAKRALKPVIAEFVQSGDVKAFDEFLSVAGDGATTLNDASVAANDFAGSLQLISNSWNQFANQQLAGPIAELAEAINSLEPDAVQNWLETGKNIALVVGGLVAVKKGVDAVKWTKGIWDAAKPSKGGAGGLGGSMADLGATPVYVVNMPGSGMGGSLSGKIDDAGDLVEDSKDGVSMLKLGAATFAAISAVKTTDVIASEAINKIRPGASERRPESESGISGLIPFHLTTAAEREADFKSKNPDEALIMQPIPGLLDVFDEMKAFTTREVQPKARPDNLAAPPPMSYGARSVLPKITPVPLLKEGERLTGAENESGQFWLELQAGLTASGLLDVFDEMKAFFTRDVQPMARPDHLAASLDIKVSDDRVTVRTRDTAPGLKVNVDAGPSLMP